VLEEEPVEATSPFSVEGGDPSIGEVGVYRIDFLDGSQLVGDAFAEYSGADLHKFLDDKGVPKRILMSEDQDLVSPTYKPTFSPFRAQTFQASGPSPTSVACARGTVYFHNFFGPGRRPGYFLFQWSNGAPIIRRIDHSYIFWLGFGHRVLAFF